MAAVAKLVDASVLGTDGTPPGKDPYRCKSGLLHTLLSIAFCWRRPYLGGVGKRESGQSLSRTMEIHRVIRESENTRLKGATQWADSIPAFGQGAKPVLIRKRLWTGS